MSLRSGVHTPRTSTSAAVPSQDTCSTPSACRSATGSSSSRAVREEQVWPLRSGSVPTAKWCSQTSFRRWSTSHSAEQAARTLGNVRTEVLDLEHISEPDEAFDVVLCREGMMFALEPRRAVAEMHRVLRPGGRATVAVWGPRSENPWLGVLLDTITEVTGIVVPPPAAPGPFALSDATELRDLFSDAGFGELRDRSCVGTPSCTLVLGVVEPAVEGRRTRHRGREPARRHHAHAAARHRAGRNVALRDERRARAPGTRARARRTPIMSAGPSKIFVVLGATGTIGRSVVELLAAKSGVTVRVTTRTPTSLPATLRLRSVTAFAFDWDTPTGLDRLLRDCDAVLLIPPSGHPAEATATQVAHAAASAGVRHMVFLSTLGADFDPGFTFGRWALAGEHAVAPASVPHTVLRPNSYMSNFYGMLRPADDGALRLPWGLGTNSFVDPRDVAECAAAHPARTDRSRRRDLLPHGASITRRLHGRVDARIGEWRSDPLREHDHRVRLRSTHPRRSPRTHARGTHRAPHGHGELGALTDHRRRGEAHRSCAAIPR